MAYIIRKEKCVNCGSCEGECPAGAISESGNIRYIDPSLCNSCGDCASICPVECIFRE